jgi:hypothetical protein
VFDPELLRKNLRGDRQTNSAEATYRSIEPPNNQGLDGATPDQAYFTELPLRAAA